jgi:tRNA 5-methylaminomethyl-2-thiouridine biosynthesis bifunctional protein
LIKKYDTIVVGAGIAGICAAHWLQKAGEGVLLVDRKGLLAGASGAAGAFLSPRLGKGGALQKITNDAYRFALEFYAKAVPDAFFQKGLVRIPKNEADADTFFSLYEPNIDVPYRRCENADVPFIDEKAMRFGAFCFDHSAFVDPMTVAEKLTEKIETVWGIDAEPVFENGSWRIGKYRSDKIVLATGAQKLPLPIPYVTIGGVWGERIDVGSDAKLPMTLHRQISVSANVNGLVRIGATHVRGDAESEVERINRLIFDAIELVPELADQRLIRILAGHRSSVSDHFPLLGAIADFQEARASLKTPPRSLKPEDPSIPHRPGCYIVTGFGGRGFVFAPLMGKILADKITEGRAIAPELSADRYLLRALRKKS